MPTMIKLPFAGAFLLAGALACASSAPSVPSPARMEVVALFAGTWSYDEAATAQAANLSGTRPEDHLSQRASDLAMAQMREQAATGDAVAGTPAGLRQTMLMVGVTPRNLNFEPSGETLSLSFDAEDPLSIPIGGDWADVTTPQGPIEARLRWSGDNFAVERRIPGGGTIRDNCAILESGHLLLDRELVWRQPQRVGLVVFRR